MTLHTNDARALFFIGQLYFHSSEIVKDPNISVKRKRSLLADWASDRNAVESKPALRRNPVTGAQCTLGEIISGCGRLMMIRYHRRACEHARQHERLFERFMNPFAVRLGTIVHTLKQCHD